MHRILVQNVGSSATAQSTGQFEALGAPVILQLCSTTTAVSIPVRVPSAGVIPDSPYSHKRKQGKTPLVGFT